MTGFSRWSGGGPSWEPFEPAPDVVEQYVKDRAERDRVFREHGIDRGELTRFLIDAAEPVRPPVLDIGTGRGLAAAELARRGHSVVTVDPDEEMLRKGITNAVADKVDGRIEFHLADANALPFDEGNFGSVVMIDVVHHLEDSANLLAEVSRVLSPGGRFMFCDFTPEGFDILDRIHGDDGHRDVRLSVDTVDRLAGDLHHHGMRCVSRDRRYHQYLVIAEKT